MAITYDAIKSISEEQLPVYRHYDGQVYPQNAFIQMTSGGDVSADYSGDIGGGMPSDVWNKKTLEWEINPGLSGSDILSAVEGNLALFERVHAGHSVEWDGSNNVGRLTDDASAANDELIEILAETQTSIEIWNVEDWLFGMDDLHIVWPAEQSLDECVAKCEDAVDRNQAIEGDFEEALIARAKYNFEYGHEDRLLPHHVEELVEREEITRDEADEWLAGQEK